MDKDISGGMNVKVIACVDDSFGMMFNKRRQSQDSVLRTRILDDLQENLLWMNAYSMKQFAEHNAKNICVDESFMKKAKSADYCFVENISLKEYEEKISEIILYKWNRRYPSDFKFDISLEDQRWKLVETEEFKGSSHEKITKEVYVK